MLIIFDGAKNQRNIDERDLAFEQAADVDFETALLAEDDRREYGEKRTRALAMPDRRLHSLVFVAIKGGIRVIGFRKANAREIRRYESQTQA